MAKTAQKETKRGSNFFEHTRVIEIVSKSLRPTESVRPNIFAALGQDARTQTIMANIDAQYKALSWVSDGKAHSNGCLQTNVTQ